MPFATISDLEIVSCELRMPRIGPWYADISLASGPDLTGEQTIKIGTTDFVGTVYRGGPFADQSALRVIGGSAALGSTIVDPKFYKGASVRQILTDLLTAANQTLSPTVESALLDQILPTWARARGKVGDALAELLKVVAPDLASRVFDDGSLWFGRESWPEVEGDHVLIQETPDLLKAEIAPEEPFLRPGTTFLDRRVSVVVHKLSSESLRTDVYFEQTEQDRFRAAINAVVDARLTSLPYRSVYPGTVVKQDAAGNLEIRLDSPDVPNPTSVAIRTGVPGATYLVPPSTRVDVAFEEAHPGKMSAVYWGDGEPTELRFPATNRIELGNSPTLGVVRRDDTGVGGTLLLTTSISPPGVTIAYGAPGAIPAPFALLSGAITVVPSPVAIPIATLNNRASTKVFAE